MRGHLGVSFGADLTHEAVSTDEIQTAANAEPRIQAPWVIELIYGFCHLATGV